MLKVNNVSGWRDVLIVLRLKASSPSLMSQDHRQSHGNNREPLLENITSDYDLELFRKAQARASEDLVRERTHRPSSHFPLSFPEPVLVTVWTGPSRRPALTVYGGQCQTGSILGNLATYTVWCCQLQDRVVYGEVLLRSLWARFTLADIFKRLPFQSSKSKLSLILSTHISNLFPPN